MFVQEPPRLDNTYEADSPLRGYLARTLPADVLREIEPELQELGALAGGPLYRLQLEDRASEPVHIPWSAWGERIDEVRLTRVWQEAEPLAVRFGLVATAYEQAHGAFSRIHQFAKVYLFAPSTDIYACPLAMTDGAARTLLDSGNRRLIERALPHLTSRDPATFWTSGQWMTELTGGSDVGSSQTVARREADGTWRLYGRKWFVSAITSQMALILARPEGNPPGGRGLALFYAELRDERGRPRGFQILRLKDKLGTRKLPTAEVLLEGLPAEPVAGMTHGTRTIAPMLNVTRTWNAITAAALMQRGLLLARDYARRRVAFGRPLAEHPLHLDTLAGLQAETAAAFHLAFCVAELMGRVETDEASDDERALLRLLTPVAKLTTARQAVAVLSEVLEAFGGAGYVEDTGLPVLLRDAQVLPIWEGTTNVLALDVLRALEDTGGLQALHRAFDVWLQDLPDALVPLAHEARAALQAADAWLAETASDPVRLQADARRFALTLGRSTALALLVRQAAWSQTHGDERPAAAARRFARHGVNLLPTGTLPADNRMLALDEPSLDAR
ncbi:acyl-CoA dehydrogenase family protein [Rhodothermus marinus]|uniref:acyl-CoA dehydrogenase family protein n=1 Tax=Rhodothermus marinus TaxID=29549 RepID=UPI0012BA4D4B|nr:acyl-CoA dehydrogenase family protein [Rhodothermus marinus]BBM70522.1 acyl-CoA dehydrogenase [Rhodothermus marinus]BBM73509.1 acyl-CoA dehydrogenase [Rhodothermus marinus]